MKKTTCLLAALTVLVSVAVVAPAFAVVCELVPIEPSVVCNHPGVKVVWAYDCNCGTPTFTIERACCPDGGWTTIATGVTGTSFIDAFMACRTVKYRITINCPGGCGCTDPCQYETPCISCP